YASFKAKAPDIQPEAGTLPEHRLPATALVQADHNHQPIDSEVEMSATPLVAGMAIRAVLHAPLERRRVTVPSRIDAAPDRPGAFGMYDYQHPDHPVNRAHQPDRVAQMQRGEHARAVERQVRTRSRR